MTRLASQLSRVGSLQGIAPWEGAIKQIKGVAALHKTDYANVPDTGCSEAPSCLACPFSICKEDDPIKFRALKSLMQHQAYKLRFRSDYDRWFKLTYPVNSGAS